MSGAVRDFRLSPVTKSAIASPSAVSPIRVASANNASQRSYFDTIVHWGAGPGKKVAIVGFGGLGHMGVKLAHALGADVTVLT